MMEMMEAACFNSLTSDEADKISLNKKKQLSNYKDMLLFASLKGRSIALLDDNVHDRVLIENLKLP